MDRDPRPVLVKPVDQATLTDAAAATGGRPVIAEDHYPQGGLGAAVLEVLAGTGLPLRVRQRAVSGLPGSGTPDELMDAAGISAARIAAAARGRQAVREPARRTSRTLQHYRSAPRNNHRLRVRR